MKLIDADTLIAKLEDDAKHMEDNIAIMFTYAAINDIKHEPTVDAVEVVRCADCKHSYDSLAMLFCSYGVCVDCEVRDDFYCAYAERRQDEID